VVYRYRHFFAKDLISIVPLLAAILWLWGPRSQVNSQRQLVIKVAMALAVSVLASFVLGHIFLTIVLSLIMWVIPSCTTRRMTPSRAITGR
jgi:hypothetical protein